MLNAEIIRYSDIVFSNDCNEIIVVRHINNSGAIATKDKEVASALDFITKKARDSYRVLYSEYFLGCPLDLDKFRNINYDKYSNREEDYRLY